MKALGDVFGYRSGGNDGDGIVGSAEVGDADEGGDAQFGSAFAGDVACEAGDNEVDPAVIADCFQHSACQQSDDDKFAHTRDTRPHGAEPVEEGSAYTRIYTVKDACCGNTYPDNSCRNNAQQ